MLSKTMIEKMYEYTCGVNGRILDKAANLTEEQLATPTNYGRGSLFDILFHAMNTEWVWRTLCQEQQIQPALMPQREAFNTIETLQASWQEEQGKMHAYLNQLTEEGLAEKVTIKRPDGTAYALVIWQMLIHMMMHSMQHRSEAAAILTDYDQSPGDLDFIYSVL